MQAVMKVLLVSEGHHEMGKDQETGALEFFVRGIYEGSLQCDLAKVSRKDIHAHHGKGRGYFKRAIRWMLEAKKNGYDALILVIDQDNQPDRIKQFTEAQKTDNILFRRALGVAIRTFDAWILADERALSQILNDTISAQSRPEEVRDAKERCAELLTNSMAQNEFYAAVAAKARIDTLEKQCPKGFAPFAERVRLLQVDSDG